MTICTVGCSRSANLVRQTSRSKIFFKIFNLLSGKSLRIAHRALEPHSFNVVLDSRSAIGKVSPRGE